MEAILQVKVGILVQFLTKDVGFTRSRVKGFMYMYMYVYIERERDGGKCFKIIKYVHDVLCYSNNDGIRKILRRTNERSYN